jgi:hypothetical protein
VQSCGLAGRFCALADRQIEPLSMLVRGQSPMPSFTLRGGAEFALFDLSDTAVVAALAVERSNRPLLIRAYHFERDWRQLTG